MASMWRWLDGTPPPKKLKKTKTSPEESVTKKASQYEAVRQRTFQSNWKINYNWLIFHDGKMYCRVCQKYDSSNSNNFVKGTNNFRLDPIKKHDQSDSHRRSVLKEKAVTSMPGTSKAEKTLVMMNKAAVGKLCTLFRNAHFVAKSRRPFTDFVKLCDLDQAKGTQIGNTYRTDKYCQHFIAAIADTRRHEQKELVEKAPFLSIISDGATDCASKETEIVYLRSSFMCKVSTFFAGLKHVGKADAPNITRAISSLLDRRFGDSWRKKIVAMGTDGASVMLGKKSGVVVRMAEETERPYLKAIHCSAHRLELAYKDSIKDIPIHQKCELLLTNLYLFYKYSPLNRSNLKLAAESIGKKAYVPSRTGGTRWLPHTKRALQNFKAGSESIVLHLEQMQQNPSKEASAKARNFLKVIKEKQTDYWMHLMMDVVNTLSYLSQAIQERESTTADITMEIESVLLTLKKYKTSNGPFLREVMSSLGNMSFSDSLISRKDKLLDNLIVNIEARFGGDSNLFKASSILSLKTWPRDLNLDIDFGDEHMHSLLQSCGPALKGTCPDIHLENIEHEWTRLKTTLVSRKQGKPSSLTELEEAFGEDFPNLFLLFNYLLTLPGSSVEAERGFSCMKIVKNDWRSRLGEDNLCDLMLVTLETAEVEAFDPLPAINLWYGQGQRARRPFYKDELKRCNIPKQMVVLDPQTQEQISVEEDISYDDHHIYLDEQPLENVDDVGSTVLDNSSSDEESDEMSHRDLIELQQKSYKMFLDVMKQQSSVF